jgi:hypothetical protein
MADYRQNRDVACLRYLIMGERRTLSAAFSPVAPKQAAFNAPRRTRANDLRPTVTPYRSPSECPYINVGDSVTAGETATKGWHRGSVLITFPPEIPRRVSLEAERVGRF